jgi:hypothetical protein
VEKQLKIVKKEQKWYDKFITSYKVTRYTAWDETQTIVLGSFDTYEEAVSACKEYAKTLTREDKL